jgi:hypothetical protein
LFAGETPEGTVTLSHDSDGEWWESFENKIIHGVLLFAPLVLTRFPADITADVIRKGFESLYSDWLSLAFPHIAAFRRCRLARAFRMILIPRGKRASEGDVRDEDAAIAQLAIGIRQGMASDSVLASLSVPEDEIAGNAMELLEALSGGKERIKVCITKDESVLPEEARLDIGLYDERFVVWSKPGKTEPDNLRREVSWYYIEELNEARKHLSPVLFAGLDALQGATVTEIGHDPEKTTSYGEFCKKVVAYMARVPKTEQIKAGNTR